MAVREIVLLGSPRLWQPSEVIVDPTSAETRALIEDLGQTLADFRLSHGFGRGIAAPQIGVNRRVIFINMSDGSFGPAPLINPHITGESKELMELWDDCFSFPDLLVRVQRHVAVEVTYLDENGLTKKVDASGGLAELLQHEIDHLDGLLATDRAIDPRAFALRNSVGSF